MYDEYLPGYDWEELIEKNIEKDIAKSEHRPKGQASEDTEPKRSDGTARPEG